MRIGVLCPSDIAIRRFMPALAQINNVEFAGVGVNSTQERYGTVVPIKEEAKAMLESEREKARAFINSYGGTLYNSYSEIIADEQIDAIYIPLPPALHYYWAREALNHGKHVLVEKPATIALKDTDDLVKIAREKQLAIHENYMFIYHNQLDAIDKIVQSGEIGEVRLYRLAFGFPKRAVNDFRYNKKLGGGALIDAGGYTIKYATKLLGENVEINCARLNYIDEFDVDVYGSATLTNAKGLTAQIAFGMDNDYKCELEIWGSKGTMRTGRVFTAPVGYIPSVMIKKNTDTEERALPTDDAFRKSIEQFILATEDHVIRTNDYEKIVMQAKLVDRFMELTENDRKKDNSAGI